MALYVNGQEKNCFVNGQQMGGYVDGVKMFGKKKRLGLIFRLYQTAIPTNLIWNSVTQGDVLEIDFEFLLHTDFTSSCVLYSTNLQRANGIFDWITASKRLGINVGNAQEVYYPMGTDTIELNTFYRLVHTITESTNTSTIAINDTFTDTTTFVGSALSSNPLIIGSVAPAYNYFFQGVFFGIRITLDGNEVGNFIPVLQGDTTYASSPAPSNCVWDTVTQQYYENNYSSTLNPYYY